MKKIQLKGNPIKRREDKRFLTGRGKYLDDIFFDAEYFAVFVRSPHPHGKIKEIRDRGIDPIILDAGDLIFSTKKIDAQNKNAELTRADAMLEGFNRIGGDAINVGHYEVLNGLKYLKNISNKTDIPFISANLKDASTSELIFKPYLIIDRGELKIGVAGVTSQLPDTSRSILADDYIESANHYAELLSNQVDIVVMLVNADRGSQGALVDQMPNVDFIVTSGSVNMSRANSPQKEDGPYMYSCGKQGKYLLSLDVNLRDIKKPFIDVTAQEKKIRSINKRFEKLQKKDPNKTLDEIYAEKQNVLNLINRYREDLVVSQKAIDDAVNTIQFQTIPLNNKVEDDDELLAFVNESVKICNALDRKKSAESAKAKKKPKKSSRSHHGHDH